MAWNQPGNNGQDRDPWGSGNNSGNSDGNNGNNGRKKQSAPVLSDLLNQLNKIFGGKGSSNNSSNSNYGHEPKFGLLFGAALAVAVVIWAGSSFYTIKEGERGVVTRFGKVIDELVQPGLNWNPSFIDVVRPVNIEEVRELGTSGVMLTADENVVHVEMNVQYKITDPKQFLFSVTNGHDSLRQATDSALRAVIGKYVMDRILTEGRSVVRDDTQLELIKTIEPYKMGITVQDVNFQAARPPEEVKEAFDDAIAAREDEQRFIRVSEAYANEVQPKANGMAARALADAKAYRERTILEAQGDVARFSRLLPEYKAAPLITRERMYIETMEKILAKTSKVLVDDKSNNLMVLPLDQLLRGQKATVTEVPANEQSSNTSATQNTDSRPTVKLPTNTSNSTRMSGSDSILQQRAISAQRTSTER